ncbi:MAG: hypothetical protein INF43_00075 [Alphaproteobacteria bacterium]|nr:hypothetical protein [Alphaproteobacteria bacterium]
MNVYIDEHADYIREIRGPDSTVYTETYTCRGLIEQIQTYTLQDGTTRYVNSWTYEPTSDKVTVNYNTFPDWWREPENTQALVKKYHTGAMAVLPTTRNVVTFCTYMEDGRMQLQRRGYRAPNGNPIGNPGMASINGGLMESDMIQNELCREVMEELGVFIYEDDATHIGDVYDAEMGRSNHVFRLNKGYDTMLIEQAKGNVAWAVEKLTKPEGVGRDFNVWAEELGEMLTRGEMTPISITILQAFPELKPPPRPKA